MKKAVIFDMDGVISNTVIFHGEIESKILAKFNISITPEYIGKKYAGTSDEEMFSDIFQKHNILLKEVTSVVVEKWRQMNHISAEEIKPIPNALSLIKDLKKSGFLLAVASASKKFFIQRVLKALSTADKFDVIVSADEVKHGKPAPDIFLLAAKRLQVKPEDAVVIEDGRSGMIGAKRAGMSCIGLVGDKKGDYPATKIITNLNQISAQEISEL